MLDSGKSELYHGGMGYDGLNRLTAFARGTLNGTRDSLTGTASRRQNWSLEGERGQGEKGSGVVD